MINFIVGIKIGNQIVSISTLAKQPWLDGWATARSLALKYLKVYFHLHYKCYY